MGNRKIPARLVRIAKASQHFAEGCDYLVNSINKRLAWSAARSPSLTMESPEFMAGFNSHFDDLEQRMTAIELAIIERRKLGDLPPKPGAV